MSRGWSLRSLLLMALPLGLLAVPPALVRAEVVPHELELTGAFRTVHDPVIMEADGRFYLFSTGIGVPVRRSDDLLHWETAGIAILGRPSWMRQHLLGVHDMWAPDISHFNGRYHLYYSASRFGRNVSAIGLATNSVLDPDDPHYQWVDHGIVIATHGVEDFNAIDPNIVVTPEGEVWMSFGSFWSGIMMRRIDPATGMLSDVDATLYHLATRPSPPHAVEAPFILHRDGFYYLFVSFDSCCRGTDSTYNIRVGRAEAVTGPYLDRDGIPMLDGGGTLLVGPSERWPGSGHNAIIEHGGQHLLVYHGYDASYGGAATLRIEVLGWDERGWPVSVNGP